MRKHRKHQRKAPSSAPSPGAPGSPDEAAYLPIPLSSLRDDTQTGFSLYMRMPSSGKYILYRDGDLHFTEAHREKLQQSGNLRVYAAAAERAHYLRYVEGNLGDIVTDARLPIAERATAVYECAIQLVDEIFQDPEGAAGIARARDLVHSTMTHLLGDPRSLAAIIGLMPSDYQLSSHSMNACILALAMGQQLGLNAGELHELGLGMLLHDVGKAHIDRHLIDKGEPPTDEERRILRTHPERGAQILHQHSDIQPGSLAVVRQHHENCAGSGYPQGLPGAEIHKFARIAALANTFDGLTTNLPWRKAFDSYPAIRIMQEILTKQFDQVFLRQLIHILARHPVETADGKGDAA